MNARTADDPPTRADVERRWRDLTAGKASREDVHEWAATWVEHRDDEITDPLVRTGLLHLHGFDMCYVDEDRRRVGHGPGASRVHSDRHIASTLERWLADCSDHDADPIAFMTAARTRARAAAEAEASRRRRRRAEIPPIAGS